MIGHILLFLAVSVPIVIMSAFYSHPDDGPALRSVPRRYAVFVVSCGVVALVMSVLQWLFVSLD